MDDDDRAKLREGDALLRRDDVVAALRLYAEVARSFARKRAELKAVAVWKQVRTLIRERARDERELDAEARAALISLCRVLGLEEDAHALETEHERDRLLN